MSTGPVREEPARLFSREVVLRTFERYFLAISRVAATLGVLFLLLVATLSVADILVREISGRPIRGVHDIAEMLTIIIIASSFPAGLMERRQIKVTILGAFLPAAGNRVLEVFGAFMTALMFLAIAYYITLHAQRVTDREEFTMVLNLPIAPWWWIATACFWICVPAQFFVTISEIFGGPDTTHSTESEA